MTHFLTRSLSSSARPIIAIGIISFFASLAFLVSSFIVPSHWMMHDQLIDSRTDYLILVILVPIAFCFAYLIHKKEKLPENDG